MTAHVSLLAELDDAISQASDDRRRRTLRRVTDLFAGNAELYSTEQIRIFEEVIRRLAADIEIAARAELSSRLAPINAAPAKIIRELAIDEAIEVAGPVLAHS